MSDLYFASVPENSESELLQQCLSFDHLDIARNTSHLKSCHLNYYIAFTPNLMSCMKGKNTL